MAGKKIKDTDYLYLSAYIHARENSIAGSEQIGRMLEANSAEEALRVLKDAGWNIPDDCSAKQLEEIMAKRRADAFADVASMAPNAALVDVFRMKYDYHNAKVLVKAAAVGTEAGRLLSDAGRIPADVLSECFLEGRMSSLPTLFGGGMQEAAAVLARTGDPQLADLALDRAYYAELAETARSIGSAFLEGYAELTVDCANLKSLVRASRMNKSDDFTAQFLVEGGSIKKRQIISVLHDREAAVTLFAATQLAAAAAQAKLAMSGEKMTTFEKLCDGALEAYMADARLSPFGEKPVLGYLCAVEAEIRAIRIVMTGHYSGIPREVTRQRLREGIL